MADDVDRDETEDDEALSGDDDAEGAGDDDDRDGEDTDPSEPPRRRARRERQVTEQPKASRRNVIMALGIGLVLGAGGGVAVGHYVIPPRRRPRRKRKPLRPAYVEVALYNPRKGPNPAKVTIVEFSDYQ